MKGKEIVGIVEKVKIIGNTKAIETYALFDTGAKRTSIDIALAAKAKLGPVLDIDEIKAASIKKSRRRPIVQAVVEIKGKKFKRKVNLEDRSHMKFPVIIGRNILRKNFIVDCEIGKEFLRKVDK